MQDEINEIIDWINNQTQYELDQINLSKEKALKELKEKYAITDKICDSSGIIAIIFLTLFAVFFLVSDMMNIFIKSASKVKKIVSQNKLIQNQTIKQNVTSQIRPLKSNSQPMRPRSFPIKCKPKNASPGDDPITFENKNKNFESSSRNFFPDYKVSIEIN